MLLCIDIGNTNIVLGVYKGSRLLLSRRILTQKMNADKYRSVFKKLLGSRKIEGIIICSVVPEVTPALSGALESLYKIKPKIVGRNIKAPIVNRYKRPKQVGQDRLVNAVAVKRKYGYPAIVVDYGTAVTFDLVSKKGEYLGGIIVPGIEISLQTLSKRAALLPKIKLARPKSLLGKDTVNSMRSGVLHGLGALTDGLVAKLRKKYGSRIPVIATGGHSRLIASFTNSINKVDQNITLEGLRIIYQTTD